MTGTLAAAAVTINAMKHPPVTSVQAALLLALDSAFDKLSWHGSNLVGAIRGVDARSAARSVGGRKTIWQQVLHAAYWKHRMLGKLAGKTRFPRRGSNWIPMPDVRDEAAWRADVALLREIHAKLRAAVAELTPGQLGSDDLVWKIQGIAAHDVYHTGQIKLMRRLLRV